MPWSVADVDRFNKGLTPKQKQKWVIVANSVLRKCLDKGGSDSDCSAKAIKAANAAVKKGTQNLSTHGFAVPAYKPEFREHLGKSVIVVPVVMMTEGVHNGSFGPIYHSIDELGKYPESWNGIPVTIDHPKRDGDYISANDPLVVESSVVGRVYNTKVKGKKLTAEAWLDSDSLAIFSPELLSYIKDGKPLEVSLGMFSDVDYREGSWSDEFYIGKAYNYRPDHLALLPTGKGACSIQDGCGIRANEAQEGGDDDETSTKLNRDKIDNYNDGDGDVPGEKELNSNANKGGNEMDKKMKALLQALELNEENIPECFKSMSDEAAAALFAFMEKKDKAVEEANKKIQDLEEKVQSLEKKNEELTKVNANKDQGDNTVNKEQAIEVLKEQLSDPDKFMELLPPEVKTQIQYGLETYERARKEIVANILKATNAYTEEELNDMQMNQLEKLAKAVKAPVNYAAQVAGSTPPAVNEVDEEPLLPFVFEDSEKKA